MPKALQIYANWYAMLYAWAALLVPQEVARTLARKAMANTFLRAARGAETSDGPWMQSCDELYSLLSRDLSLTSESLCTNLLGCLPHPCDRELYDMAMLYSGVYHAVYTAQLSLHQREHMALLIAGWSPCLMSDDEISRQMQGILGEAHPLRCVVNAFEGHTHAGELICDASESLWKSEHLKGRRWLAEGAQRQEVA